MEVSLAQVVFGVGEAPPGLDGLPRHALLPRPDKKLQLLLLVQPLDAVNEAGSGKLSDCGWSHLEVFGVGCCGGEEGFFLSSAEAFLFN